MNTIDCSPIVFTLARWISSTAIGQTGKSMDSKQGFAKALKAAREFRRLTQEDFSLVSSRTYISSLERGLKSPTLEKIEDLAGRLEIHPLTLVALAYLESPPATDAEQLLEKVLDQLDAIKNRQT